MKLEGIPTVKEFDEKKFELIKTLKSRSNDFFAEPCAETLRQLWESCECLIKLYDLTEDDIGYTRIPSYNILIKNAGYLFEIIHNKDSNYEYIDLVKYIKAVNMLVNKRKFHKAIFPDEES